MLSMGESWHNLHHADPTCARHGVDPGQLDSSARIIRWFELAGWATKVRWPDPTPSVEGLSDQAVVSARSPSPALRGDDRPGGQARSRRNARRSLTTKHNRPAPRGAGRLEV